MKLEETKGIVEKATLLVRKLLPGRGGGRGQSADPSAGEAAAAGSILDQQQPAVPV